MITTFVACVMAVFVKDVSCYLRFQSLQMSNLLAHLVIQRRCPTRFKDKSILGLFRVKDSNQARVKHMRSDKESCVTLSGKRVTCDFPSHGRSAVIDYDWFRHFL